MSSVSFEYHRMNEYTIIRQEKRRRRKKEERMDTVSDIFDYVFNEGEY